MVYSCPGKSFICGEYSVLFGGKALVAAAGPRFSLSVRPAGQVGSRGRLNPDSHILFASPDGAAVRVSGIAAGSPAARWLEIWVERARLIEDVELSFADPLEGAGGFGASTAQFGLLARALGGERDWSQLWREYRALHENEAVPPSGADLAAQMLGGVISFSTNGPHADAIKPVFEGAALALFSATGLPGRKVRTHEHLRGLGSAGLRAVLEPVQSRLEEIVDRAVSGLRSGDTQSFGASLNEYASSLSEVGMEAAEASKDRLSLARIEGVLGIKGTGALLADGVIAICREDALERLRIAAAERGLRPIDFPFRLNAEGWRSE